MLPTLQLYARLWLWQLLVSAYTKSKINKCKPEQPLVKSQVFWLKCKHKCTDSLKHIYYVAWNAIHPFRLFWNKMLSFENAVP